MNRLYAITIGGLILGGAVPAGAQGAARPHPAAAQAIVSACPTHQCADDLLEPRTLRAVKIAGSPPVIDGRLDEAAWTEAPVAARFVQSAPQAGAESQLRSEARVLYDDRALYVSLRLFDPDPASIVAPFVRRDDETSCDWAFVEIDSRHDHRSAFSFGLNPRGVQSDGVWLNDVTYDGSWNGVWDGAAAIDRSGWTAEFRIPFTELPHEAGQGVSDWGINFYRNSQHHGETSNWSPRLPWWNGVVSHFNDLQLQVPPHNRRIEVVPFSLVQAESRSASLAQQSPALLGREGFDARLGLGSAFTLSGSVLPDFGQVEADPSQLNLTAFELFQPEQRPLFVEGMEAFRLDTSLDFVTRDDSFRDESPFYSRRIGRAPRGALPAGARIESVPVAATIVAAAKLSGRTANGWTVGVLDATTRSAQARVDDGAGRSLPWTIEPLAQVTLLRLSKSFDHDNGAVGTLFTSTVHPGLDPRLAARFVSSAWTAGVDGRRRFDAGRYEVTGWFMATRLQGTPAAILAVADEPRHELRRPDRPPRAGQAGQLSGFAGQTKLSGFGDHLRWHVAGEAISPGYDVNELGFQRNADWLLLTGSWQYERFTANRYIRHWMVGSDNGSDTAGATGLGWDWAGEPRARTVTGFLQLDTTSYWTGALDWTHDFPAVSTDWLRGGPALGVPGRDSLHYSIVSDQRRPSSVRLDGLLIEEPGTGSHTWAVNPQIDFRSAAHLHGAVGVDWQQDTLGWQYVTAAMTHGNPLWLVARDRQKALTLTLRAEYAFSPHLSFQFYAQPFVTTGRYDGYKVLADARAADAGERFTTLAASRIAREAAGGATGLDLDGDHRTDVSFPTPDGLERDLNADAVLRWEYRRGSFLTAVWNRRSEVVVPLGQAGFGLSRLTDDPATNVFLLKLTYYFAT